MYDIIWNNEVIDVADSESEADFMVGEYNMAYNTHTVSKRKA